MFHIVIAGLCLTAATTPISAQLQQNAPGLGFQPTNNLTVAKGPGWPAPAGPPPPPPPGSWGAPPPSAGWPASPPPPPGGGWPATQTNSAILFCQSNGTPVPTGATCPSVDGLTSVYFASTYCSCFFQCSQGSAKPMPCSAGLQFNPSTNVCDYPANVKCTGNQTPPPA